MKTRSVELCKNLQKLKLIKNELKKFKTILSLTDEYTSFIIKRDTYSLTLDIIKDEELFGLGIIYRENNNIIYKEEIFSLDIKKIFEALLNEAVNNYFYPPLMVVIWGFYEASRE